MTGENFSGGCKLCRTITSSEEESDSTAHGGIAGDSSS